MQDAEPTLIRHPLYVRIETLRADLAEAIATAEERRTDFTALAEHHAATELALKAAEARADAAESSLAQVTQERDELKRTCDGAHKAITHLSQEAHLEWTRAQKAEADRLTQAPEADTVKLRAFADSGDSDRATSEALRSAADTIDALRAMVNRAEMCAYHWMERAAAPRLTAPGEERECVCNWNPETGMRFSIWCPRHDPPQAAGQERT
jgi:chromosome segregation ATPase